MQVPFPQVAVREAYSSDLNAITALERQCFAIPWSRQSIRHELTVSTHAYSLCATGADGTVLGYLIGWKIAPEFHLGNLAVAPEHRQRGIASALCTALFDDLERNRYSMATLEVREHNAPALALYRRFGFAPVALRKGYYADTGENAVVMIKYLDHAAAPHDIVGHET